MKGNFGAFKGGVIPYIKDLAKKFHKKPTKAEAILWAALRNRQLADLKFRRQFSFGRYIADFYCHGAKLIIEIDGTIHETPDQKDYDNYRNEIMETNGLKIIRLKNEEIISNLEQALNKIMKKAKDNSI